MYDHNLGFIYDALMWSGSEIFVILVCGSVHPLRPLWDRYVNKKPRPSGYDVQHNNKSYIAAAYADTNPKSNKNKTGSRASAQQIGRASCRERVCLAV